MRVFVTGGSGFLGRYLIRSIAEAGDESVALARSDQAAQSVSEAGATRVVRGDLGDVEAMTEGMQGCDSVIHGAALAADWGDRDSFFRINVGGTKNVLAAARSARVPRFVHIGTEAVLVGGPPIVSADESWQLPDRPIGLYPITKGLAEEAVIEANGDGLTTTVVRPRLIWGAGDTSVMPKIIEAVEDGRFRWIGGGRHLTSTCHVRNVVEGVLLAAQKGRGGERYFLTDGEPVEMREFLTKMLQTQGVDPGGRSVPRWVARSAAWTIEAVWKLFGIKKDPPMTRTAIRLIGEEVTVVDQKARDELGYEARVTIEEGLEEMRAAKATAQGTR